MKTNYLLCLCLIACFCSCKNTTKQTQADNQTSDSIEMQEVIKQLPELVSEELFLKGKEPFGEVIELKGKQIIADTVIFKIMEAEGIIKDDKFFFTNQRKLPAFSPS